MKIKQLTDIFTRCETDGLWYAECRKAPVRIGGLPFLPENGNYHRLPDRLCGQYSTEVQTLYKHTSGGTVTFRTDSAVLGFRVTLEVPDKDVNMSYNGISGLDVFADCGAGWKHAGIVSAPLTPGGTDERGTVRLFPGMQEVCVYLPLYAGVVSIEIGFDGDAELEPPTPLPHALPVGFYGSSITQGGSANRAGCDYQAMLARDLGFDIFNLGFSGSGRGEPLIASLIAGVPMEAFVLDYDHNAPDAAHLAATHYNFYKIIRDAQPTLPIILMSMTDTDHNPDWRERREIILSTFVRARSEGDTHIEFVDGSLIYGTEYRDVCTVDGIHPNEFGFHLIYKTLLPILGRMLGK